MNSKTLPSFWRCYHQLPADVRKTATDASRLFSSNPNHPSLRFSRMHWDPRYWYARVSRNYRAVGIVNGNTITWVWIGSHADFDKMFVP